MARALKRDSFCIFAAAMLLMPVFCAGTVLAEPARSAFLTADANAAYRTYLDKPDNRAFAIAPGGAWGWASGSATMELAENLALANCRKHTEQPCHVYAVNDQVVLNMQAWNSSWVLPAPANNQSSNALGVRRGDKFPDLAFVSPAGQASTLSRYRGEPVFLHFWGSWCPPCKHEFPDIQKLYDVLGPDRRIRFVLLQAREPLAKSQRWAARRGITIPLHDSGHSSISDKSFQLANGNEIGERRFAGQYPTTYLLDSDGRVVFQNSGPLENWTRLAPLIRNMK